MKQLFFVAWFLGIIIFFNFPIKELFNWFGKTRSGLDLTSFQLNFKKVKNQGIKDIFLVTISCILSISIYSKNQK